MGVYLAERYLPGLKDQESDTWLLEVLRQRRDHAEASDVRCLESIVLVEEEACLSLYEGPSPEAVRLEGERAGVRFDRITEVVRVAGQIGPSGALLTSELPRESTVAEAALPAARAGSRDQFRGRA